MEQDLQSSISYAGGRDITSLKHVDYVIVKIQSGMGILSSQRGLAMQVLFLLQYLYKIERE